MWTWTLWLILVLVLVATSFAYLEARALHNGTPTLSRWTWRVSNAFPAFPFIVGLFLGLIIGFLACHFWWGGIVPFAPV